MFAGDFVTKVKGGLSRPGRPICFRLRNALFPFARAER